MDTAPRDSSSFCSAKQGAVSADELRRQEHGHARGERGIDMAVHDPAQLFQGPNESLHANGDGWMSRKEEAERGRKARAPRMQPPRQRKAEPVPTRRRSFGAMGLAKAYVAKATTSDDDGCR
jgi:hypothetical protein